MRIDSIKGMNVYETIAKESAQSKKTQLPAAASLDRLELSNEGLKFKEASSAAAKIKEAVSQDADEEKIRALQVKIADGTYQVSSTELADAIVGGFLKSRA